MTGGSGQMVTDGVIEIANMATTLDGRRDRRQDDRRLSSSQRQPIREGHTYDVTNGDCWPFLLASLTGRIQPRGFRPDDRWRQNSTLANTATNVITDLGRHHVNRMLSSMPSSRRRPRRLQPAAGPCLVLLNLMPSYDTTRTGSRCGRPGVPAPPAPGAGRSGEPAEPGDVLVDSGYPQGPPMCLPTPRGRGRLSPTPRCTIFTYWTNHSYVHSNHNYGSRRRTSTSKHHGDTRSGRFGDWRYRARWWPAGRIHNAHGQRTRNRQQIPDELQQDRSIDDRKTRIGSRCHALHSPDSAQRSAARRRAADLHGE